MHPQKILHVHREGLFTAGHRSTRQERIGLSHALLRTRPPSEASTWPPHILLRGLGPSNAPHTGGHPTTRAKGAGSAVARPHPAEHALAPAWIGSPPLSLSACWMSATTPKLKRGASGALCPEYSAEDSAVPLCGVDRSPERAFPMMVAPAGAREELPARGDEACPRAALSRQRFAW